MVLNDTDRAKCDNCGREFNDQEEEGAITSSDTEGMDLCNACIELLHAGRNAEGHLVPNGSYLTGEE